MGYSYDRKLSTSARELDCEQCGGKTRHELCLEQHLEWRCTVCNTPNDGEPLFDLSK